MKILIKDNEKITGLYSEKSMSVVSMFAQDK